MKRDMDLIRRILFKIEDDYIPGNNVLEKLKIEGFSMQVIAEHCSLLFEVGFIDKYILLCADDGLYGLFIGNLSNKGYNYLETIRMENTLEATKKEVKKKKLPETLQSYGTVAASLVGAFLREYTK